VTSNTYYQNVDKPRLQQEFAGLQAKPPAAFDRRLYEAAEEHSLWMNNTDEYSHGTPGTPTYQFERIKQHFNYISFSGYSARGNIFHRAKGGTHCHATWNVDWGSPWNHDEWWMQEGRGHRMAIMSVDGDYTNVGIALVSAQNPSAQVVTGPLVATGNYCRANTSYSYHYNRFLVGTVWKDNNANAMYDPGEGIGNVTVMPDHGTYYAVTGDSGGYAIPIEAAGTYVVTFFGPSLSVDAMKTADVGDESILLDLELLQKGDINGNGNVDLDDAILALQVILGLNPSGVHPDYLSSGADVNGDGKIGWEEVSYILQRASGPRA
jgi:hypothetical protein